MRDDDEHLAAPIKPLEQNFGVHAHVIQPADRQIIHSRLDALQIERNVRGTGKRRLQRFAEALEQRLRNVKLHVREHPWHVQRRLRSIRAEQQFDHGVDKVAIKADQDPRVPGLRVEHGRD